MGGSVIGDSKVKVKEFQHVVLGNGVRSEKIPEM